jgi:PAS domain S-box-containing protein
MHFVMNPLFQALFNTPVPRIVLKADAPHFTIMAYNAAYGEATYTANRDIKGMHLWEAFKPEDAGGDGGQIYLEALMKALETKNAVHVPSFLYAIPAADGVAFEKSWWQLEIIPVPGQEVEIGYLLITTHNVTAQVLNRELLERSQGREQQLNEELAATNEELSAANEELVATIEELRQAQDELQNLNTGLEAQAAVRTKALDEKIKELSFLADSIPSIVWTAGPDGKLDYINRRWYERNPTGDELPLGENWLTNLHPDDLERVRAAWKISLDSGNPYEIEFRIKRRGGKYNWYLVRALPLRNDSGEIIKWYGNNTDIQAQKDLQQQKDDFISIASHELKTPITSLKASLQLLDRMKDNPNPAMVRNLVMQARKGAEKIGTLVGDLLDVKRLQEGQMGLNKTDFVMAELVSAVCNPITIAGKYRFEIAGDTTLHVLADEHRIDQVLSNFIHNAIKYAPGADLVRIKIEQMEDCLKVSVIESGPGIPVDKLPYIFDRYFRADHSGDKYSGLGLGLYISAEIVKRHSGEIGVDSIEGSGSTFWFTLPLDADDQSRVD